jgi:broad specificity phosphatase PhoE
VILESVKHTVLRCRAALSLAVGRLAERRGARGEARRTAHAVRLSTGRRRGAPRSVALGVGCLIVALVLTPPEQTWPSALWLIRHGESAGNVARNAAEAAGLPLIDIAERDIDVPLSSLGERQARALGRWFARLPEDQQPTVVLSSPYVRAMQTTELILSARTVTPAVRVVDERLREKEFGVFNRLTKAGIASRFPDQAELRNHIGKFYYRPPSGESWCDVVLRLRSVMAEMQLQYRRERVLVVAHQVIVLCFRYLVERMTEQQILAIDEAKDVANCSISSYAFEHDEAGRGDMALKLYNFVTPLEVAGEPVTVQPDAPAAPR